MVDSKSYFLNNEIPLSVKRSRIFNCYELPAKMKIPRIFPSNLFPRFCRLISVGCRQMHECKTKTQTFGRTNQIFFFIWIVLFYTSMNTFYIPEWEKKNTFHSAFCVGKCRTWKLHHISWFWHRYIFCCCVRFQGRIRCWREKPCRPYESSQTECVGWHE